jgi:hypothetical protein
LTESFGISTGVLEGVPEGWIGSKHGSHSHIPGVAAAAPDGANPTPETSLPCIRGKTAVSSRNPQFSFQKLSCQSNAPNLK